MLRWWSDWNNYVSAHALAVHVATYVHCCVECEHNSYCITNVCSADSLLHVSLSLLCHGSIKETKWFLSKLQLMNLSTSAVLSFFIHVWWHEWVATVKSRGTINSRTVSETILFACLRFLCICMAESFLLSHCTVRTFIAVKLWWRISSNDCQQKVSIQWNLSIKDTLNKGHLSNEDAVCCPYHTQLRTNVPLN